MPRLLTFGACRQAIINRDDGSLSLISLLSSLTIQRAADQIIPADAMIPFEWGAGVAWLRLDGDEGKIFEQRFQMIGSGGNITEVGMGVFGSEGRLMVSVLKASGFPAGQAGTVVLNLQMREAGKEHEWTTYSEYPIEVIHQKQEGASGVPA